MKKKLGFIVVVVMAGTLLFSGVSMAGLCSDLGKPNGCVVAGDLRNQAVTAPKIKPDSVNTNKIKDLNVKTQDLADGAVNSAKVLDNSLTANDLATNSVNYLEIATGAVRSAEILDNSILATDLQNEAGLDFAGSGSRTIAGISTNSAARTNIASVAVTAPSSNGYVVVQFTGYVKLTTADRWINLCIDNSSGGSTCDSLQHYIEINADEVASQNYEDRTPISIQRVYAVGAGTQTYYLKAYIEPGATGTIAWDYFPAMFFPTRY